MNPLASDVLNAIQAGGLTRVLRGEECVFRTPSEINDDMLPTDHAELLMHGIYPLTEKVGVVRICSELEQALADACRDAWGVFCAHQCFYIELVHEREVRSPLNLSRTNLSKILGAAFIRESAALRSLAFRPSDIAAQRPYTVTVSGMRILARDYGVDWGVAIRILDDSFGPRNGN